MKLGLGTIFENGSFFQISDQRPGPPEKIPPQTTDLYPDSNLSQPTIDFQVLAPLSTAELNLHDKVVRLLYDPYPSRCLIEYLQSSPLPPTVASHVMVAAGQRKLFLSDDAWKLLLNSMPRSVTEQCLIQMAQEKANPLVMLRLLSLLASHYPGPNPFIAHLNNLIDPRSTRTDDCKGFVLFKSKIDTYLAIPSQATEAQRQFLLYAKKIVVKEVALYPIPCRAMNVWIKTFLETAKDISQNDLSEDSLALPAPSLDGMNIHEPLYMTVGCFSIRQKSSPDLFNTVCSGNEDPTEVMRPYSPLYDTFCQGLWKTEERSAIGLKNAVLKIRRDWAIQIQDYVIQCGQWARAVRSTIEAVDSGMIHQAFANLRLENQIAFIQNVVKRAIGQMASNVLVSERPAKVILPLPTTLPEYAQNHSFLSQMWLKVSPTNKDLPLVTVATPSGIGTFKIVWKVVRLIGEALPNHIASPVYAYAKFKALARQRQAGQLLSTCLSKAQVQNDFRREKQLRSKLETTSIIEMSIRAKIEEEVTISQRAGTDVAVPMWIQRKTFNPEAIKSIEMDYWDTNLSNFLRNPLTQKIRIRTAYCVCSLIATLHVRNILHLDVKCENLLCRKQDHHIDFRLTDFGTAIRNYHGKPYPGPVSTFRPPEVLGRMENHPQLGPWLDVWGLGVTVFEILYGYNTFSRIVDKNGEPRPQRTVINAINEYESGGGHPKAAAVLRGLLDFSPKTRWSAQQAKEAFAAM
jgi:tRNA A-37 threonylcarbamoyl transferase component Bud32